MNRVVGGTADRVVDRAVDGDVDGALDSALDEFVWIELWMDLWDSYGFMDQAVSVTCLGVTQCFQPARARLAMIRPITLTSRNHWPHLGSIFLYFSQASSLNWIALVPS